MYHNSCRTAKAHLILTKPRGRCVMAWWDQQNKWSNLFLIHHWSHHGAWTKMKCFVVSHHPPPPLSVSVLCLGSEFRVGRSPGRHEENAERHAACRERQGRKRQVQNPASNPPGQHQAAHWWVWVYVNQEEGWTQWWNQTVRVIAMPTPHFLCKAQNLLPPQELLLLLFFLSRRKSG